ncbi:MAG: TlpA family protein disulfide reductase [Rhizobacter sp.]
MNVKRVVAAAVAASALGLGAYFGLPIFLAPERAPTIAYTLLNAQAPATSQWQGKVTLVNFWATSCVTCVKEMPEIVATHNKYKTQGFDTLAVAMSYDPPAYVARFAESRQLPFGVAIDNTGEIARQFGDVQLTPTTFIVNKRGEIVKQFVGEPDFTALHLLIEKLLAEG